MKKQGNMNPSKVPNSSTTKTQVIEMLDKKIQKSSF
jgi:hypothetical protein